jgi:predicted phage tail protein|tara:strand:+ start:3665 stop:7090 length:3426 start_codon:yes stop_codon:yes gene_type:complete
MAQATVKVSGGSAGSGRPTSFFGMIVEISRNQKSLESRQAINIIEVLSEGEIEGFPSAAGLTQGTDAYNKAALKDVFLGKTPIVKSSADPNNILDSDFNFQRITFEPRFGTTNQTHIKGIKDIETEEAVGVAVTNAQSVTRTITQSDIDALRITVRFDALLNINSKDGKNLGDSVGIFIVITDNNGVTQTFDESTNASLRVRGKSRTAYTTDYRINLKPNIAFPIQVTVGRTDPDDSSTTRTNTFSWSSFTKLIDQQKAYPDIAHLFLRFDSQQFPSIPPRMYKIRGVKIKIPHNATVDQTNGRLIYTGTFNGTLTTTTHWTSDPSWILFNLLTETRFGLGDHITETQLDKYAFYSASVYCSELVDDGQGGQEPRFSCNTVLQKREDAYETVMALSSVMRGMTFWGAGSLTLTQDRPTDSSYLFNLSNVTQEGFLYSGTSLKTRSTVVSVSYFDMENQELNFETVEDTTAKNKYGIIQKKVTGFGCSSRNQARRLGRFILFEEQNATETINFSTGIAEGVIVRPGQVIEVSDPLKAGKRRGGRIKSATTTTVTVDDTSQTDLDKTNSPTLSVVLPNGTVETKNVVDIVGDVISINSATPFSTAPNANSVWILQNTTLETTQWRVVGVLEDKDNYTITATSYIPGKYAFIEDGTALPVRNITVLNQLVAAPSSPTVQEEFFIEGTAARTKLNISFNPEPLASMYLLEVKYNNGNSTVIRSRSNEIEILDSLAGNYEFRLFSLNASLEPSANPQTFSFNAVGKTAIPADVTGLTIEPISTKTVRLRWNLSTDIDVTHGGRVYVRHSTKTDGTGTFSNATDLVQALPGNSTFADVPYLEGEYILKFQDDGGRFSAGETSVIVDLPDTQGSLLALTRREDLDTPKFQGTKTNVAFDATTNALTLTGVGQFDSIVDFDAVPSLDDIGGVSSSGTYEFGGAAATSFLDLGAVFSLDLKRHFLTEAFFPSDLFDAISDIDARVDFDGSIATKVNAEMLVAVTQDDPSTGTPTYTAFQTFANGTYKGRGFKFKVNMTSGDPDQDIRVTQLGYTASLQRRTEQSTTAITSGAGAKAVTFTNTFFTGTSSIGGVNSNLPSIAVQPVGSFASGDFFEITNVSGTGFTVHFKNASNASISRDFTYQAVGFGKG